MSSGVEFDEDKFSYSKPPVQASAGMPQMTYGRPIPDNAPKMAKWLMRHGIKSTASAQTVLVIVVIINIIVTFIVVNVFIL
jgi:hypothetical protein